MGAYRFLDNQTADTNGIILTATGAQIPNNPALAAWREYEAWKAEPNTPDAANATPLATYKKSKKAAVDLASEEKFAQDLRLQSPVSPLAAAVLLKAVQEAIEIERDGQTFAAARHPLIDKLIGTMGASGAQVATNLSAWWDSVKARVGETNAARLGATSAINAAANIAAVDAVGVTWPSGGGAGE